MTRNIIIILVSVGIVSWNFYVFKKRKSFSFTTKNFALGFLVLWLLSTFIFNIPVILSPLTPAISGTVIDAETKQPIANCNIKAYWEIESGTPAGGHWETYHQFITKTNGKGKFHVPRYMKVMGLYGFFPIIVSRYGGVKIIAYTHGYKYALGGIDPFSSMLTIIEPSQPTSITETIQMEKSRPAYLVSDIYQIDSVFESTNKPRGKTSEDKKYLLDDSIYYYERMETIFKKSAAKEIESALICFATQFKEFGAKEKAIEVYQRLKREFPENAGFADREIEQLTMSIKKNGGVSR